MKILKSFSFSVIIAAVTITFLWLTFLALCNFTELSNKTAMDITIGVVAVIFFTFVIWLFDGFKWLKKFTT